jgi:hypothetical protein
MRRCVEILLAALKACRPELGAFPTENRKIEFGGCEI